MARNETLTARPTVNATGWPVRLGISAGFGGFLMLMGALSFPLPWTPVPFSMMPFGLLVAGAYQRPQWAGLSVLIYLVAGGLGVPVYADGSSGFHHLIGATGGYLVGYAFVAALVGWYVSQQRRLMPTRWAYGLLGLVGVVVLGGVFAIIRFVSAGEGLGTYDDGLASWGLGRSVLWVLLYLIGAATLVTIWALRRQRGESGRVLNLFLIFLGSTALLHVCGVTGLILVGGYPIVTSIVLGSVVFLPFDIIKAGLAVGISLPFLPTEPTHAQH